MTTVGLVGATPAARAGQGCRCEPLTPRRQLDAADVVFVGVVVSVGADGVVFRLEQGFKGAVGRAPVVVPADDACGRALELVVGERYLVYARRVSDRLEVDVCGGTAPAAEGAVPPGIGGAADVDRGPGPGVAALASLLVVVVGGAALVVSSRRHRGGRAA